MFTNKGEAVAFANRGFRDFNSQSDTVSVFPTATVAPVLIGIYEVKLVEVTTKTTSIEHVQPSKIETVTSYDLK